MRNAGRWRRSGRIWTGVEEAISYVETGDIARRCHCKMMTLQNEREIVGGLEGTTISGVDVLIRTIVRGPLAPRLNE
jgi:hypothetical protein